MKVSTKTECLYHDRSCTLFLQQCTYPQALPLAMNKTYGNQK